MRRISVKSHLGYRIDARAPTDSKTAAVLNAKDRSSNRVQKASQSCFRSHKLPNSGELAVVRLYNLPNRVGWDGSFLYPSESPLNFTPLRSIPNNLPGSLPRAAREVPWESKDDILNQRMVRPEFANECRGTPRREFQGGMIDGVRTRPIANPFFKPYGQILKQFDRWASRHWERWTPKSVTVRGGSRIYEIPSDILPKKNELGEWTTPTLSGRYQADIKRQYAMHGLPWIYKRDFLQNKLHILDKEPIGPKRWYKKEYRQAKIREAMRNMDSLVDEYRKERRAAKKKNWFEQIIHKLVGSQLSSKYISERKMPKL